MFYQLRCAWRICSWSSFSHSWSSWLILSKLAIYFDDTTLYFYLDKTNDLFDTVETAADLEHDLRTVVEWGEKWLVTFNAAKTKLSINQFRKPKLPYVFSFKWQKDDKSLFSVLWNAARYLSPSKFHKVDFESRCDFTVFLPLLPMLYISITFIKCHNTTNDAIPELTHNSDISCEP